MSHGAAFQRRAEPARQPHRYDSVPRDTLPRYYDPGPPRDRQTPPPLAASADPLPPPPLPHQPAVGPEGDPGDGEGDLDPPDPALDIDLKPVHRFVPDSWKSFFSRGSSSGRSSSNEGVRCSPPHSPVPGSYRDPYGGGSGGASSFNSRRELLDPRGSLSGQTQRTGMTYSERVEEYHQRYAYMKSWAGLLRILGCVELLLGAAVFACVCAYVHKDNEWFNMYGYSSPGGGYGGGAGGAYGGYGGYGGGSYYTGPKTPFVLVVAGLAWLVTVIMLVLGMTMYYRTILLDSHWWPLTEFTINLALAVLYMTAAIIYVRDTTRGGLCSNPVFSNPINGAFCRTEAGQTAAIIFLFLTMLLYLIGALVCLKLWRHEAARLYREKYGLRWLMPMPCTVVPIRAGPRQGPPQILQGAIPSGHIPKPVIMPDYIAKYPTVRADEERDQYRAVFNDQYAEYKELHAEVQAALKRFDEMDAMMRTLPQQPSSQMELDRINRILQDYKKKKNDPTFLEKKERCDYLKNKLAHIKLKIQEYDKVMEWNDGY
uniref:MARVEL domain-containing protein 2 n=1 Tax=Gadus morhua TaxID=8049 RepID=A0A8C4ZEQ2_GADMO